MSKTIKYNLLLCVAFACVFAFTFGLSKLGFNLVTATKDSNYAAKIDDSEYESYEQAWNSLSDGDTIEMLNDWAIDQMLTVPSESTITVNMNGHVIDRGLSQEQDSGEIFLLKPDSKLIINGGSADIVHYGTLKEDVWYFQTNEQTDYMHGINGGLLTGAFNANGGGAIHVQANAELIIDGVTIAGNISSGGGGAGAIRMQGDSSKLTLENSKLCYNKATGGGGGAIRIEGVDATVSIKNSIIRHNTTTDGSSDGGAIQINNGTVNLINSEISFNTSKRNGGGIYAYNGNLFVDEQSTIMHNVSNKEGGGIYVNKNADKVEIKGVLSGNSAKEEGGAIYVNSSIDGEKGVKIIDAELLGNTSIGNGGGIYVDEDNDIVLSGKVVVNGCSPNNLYVKTSSTISASGLTDGAMIGITCSYDATASSPINNVNSEYVVCDKQGYTTAGDQTCAYFVEASKQTPTQLSVGGYQYPIQRGSFVYSAVSGGQMTAYYYYSDAYFASSAKYYNEHLATMSLNMAMAASTAKYDGEYTEAKASNNIRELLSSMGFDSVYFHYPKPKYYGEDGENLSTIGYIIASKTVSIAEEERTIIATAVRGGGYGAEWASNVTLGSGVGEAKGFGDAANQVEEGLKDYLEEYELDTTKCKFWIAGFSRSAATSNLVAKRLTDEYGEDNVFGYCFETPKGGVHGELKKGNTYSNIHSIINKGDLVTMVGTTEMGFIRYGVEHVIPAYKVGEEEYDAQKEKMLAQLAAICPSTKFNDYFHQATVEYIEAYIGSWFTDVDYIQEVSRPKYGTSEEWIPYFIKKLQEYSLTDDQDGSDYNRKSENFLGYRNFWSSYEWYLYEENGNLKIKSYADKPEDFDTTDYTVLTLEGAIAYVMNFYFGASEDKKDKIMSALDVDTIMDNLSLSDIYWDIIGKWNGFGIDKKNEEFNKVWNSVKIEESLSSVLGEQEMKDLKKSFYVILDFLLDFVSDDYDNSSQDIVGTLIYNVKNMLQTHYFEVVCAWMRSYDSFYANDFVSPPLPPTVSLGSGTYRDSVRIELVASSTNDEIYYTLDGSEPNVGEENCYLYQGPITLSVPDDEYEIYSLKAIAVNNGIASEVVNYNYVLNTNAEISFDGEEIRVSNFSGTAYLVVAEYNDGVMQAIEHFEVTNYQSVFKADLSLNFENQIIAHLVRDFKKLNPLCAPVNLTDGLSERNFIDVDAQHVIILNEFFAEQANDPEFINVKFTTESTNSEYLAISLFAKGYTLTFNNALYFNQIKKNDQNVYSFTVKRSVLQNVLGNNSVNNSTLVLTVGTTGIEGVDLKEYVYKEDVYTIIYHLDGGTNNVNNPSVYTISTPTITLKAPTKEHYDFLGWYKDGEISIAVTTISGLAEDIELYAKWKKKKYTITYTDGVSEEEIFADKSYTVEYDCEMPSFGDTNPEREGYVFSGWDKAIAKTVTESVVYTAVWEKKHAHEPILIDGVEATCTKAGHLPYYECVGCGFYEDEGCTKRIMDIDAWKQTDGLTTKQHDYSEKIEDLLYLVSGSGSNCQEKFKYYFVCAECGAIGAETWESDQTGAHEFDTVFTHENGQHYHVCKIEGCAATTAKINCSGGSADCKHKAVCAACEHEYGELGDHQPTLTYDYKGEDGHAHICGVCEITLDVEEHVDQDGDYACDVCGYQMEEQQQTEEPPTNDSDGEKDDENEHESENESENESEDKGLKTGAIIAIVASSTVVVATGGFSVGWFVIKKKKWSDLIKLFKKK